MRLGREWLIDVSIAPGRHTTSMCVYTYVGRPRDIPDVVPIEPQHVRVTVRVGCGCPSVETHLPSIPGWLHIRYTPVRTNPACIRMRRRRLCTSRTWSHHRHRSVRIGISIDIPQIHLAHHMYRSYVFALCTCVRHVGYIRTSMMCIVCTQLVCS